MNRGAIGSPAGPDENAASAAFASDVRVVPPFDFDGLAPWLRWWLLHRALDDDPAAPVRTDLGLRGAVGLDVRFWIDHDR